MTSRVPVLGHSARPALKGWIGSGIPTQASLNLWKSPCLPPRSWHGVVAP